MAKRIFKKAEIKNKEFMRIPWSVAKSLLQEKLQEKYSAWGEMRFIKKYGYEPEGEHYDFPDFVDIEINA